MGVMMQLQKQPLLDNNKLLEARFNQWKESVKFDEAVQRKKTLDKSITSSTIKISIATFITCSLIPFFGSSASHSNNEIQWLLPIILTQVPVIGAELLADSSSSKVRQIWKKIAGSSKKKKRQLEEFEILFKTIEHDLQKPSTQQLLMEQVIYWENHGVLPLHPNKNITHQYYHNVLAQAIEHQQWFTVFCILNEIIYWVDNNKYTYPNTPYQKLLVQLQHTSDNSSDEEKWWHKK